MTGRRLWQSRSKQQSIDIELGDGNNSNEQNNVDVACEKDCSTGTGSMSPPFQSDDGNNHDSDESEDDNESNDDDDDSDSDDETGTSDSSDSTSESHTTDTSSHVHSVDDDIHKHITDYTTDQSVLFWRRIVIFSILAAGAIVSSLSYKILKQEVSNKSNEDFVVSVNILEDSSKLQMKGIFESGHALSRYITMTGMTSKSDFPFVMVPSFEVHAASARLEANIDAIFYAPIVQTSSKDNNKNYERWVEFTTETKDWLDESKQQYDRILPGLNRSGEPKQTYLPPVVYRFENGTGYKKPWFGATDNNTNGAVTFCPRLYTSPPPFFGDGIVQNEDLFSNQPYLEISDVAAQEKDVVFGRFLDHNAWDPTSGAINFSNDDNNNFTHAALNNQTSDPPRSISSIPVYKSLSDKNGDPVGYLFGIISWEPYLMRIIPESIQGIVVVLKNSCNDSATYTFENKQLVRVSNSTGFDLSKKINIPITQSLGESAGHCHFSLDVYPTNDYDDDVSSNIAMKFTLVVAALFMLMATSFLIYARYVYRRNKKVESAAARSNAIVSSFFPSNVRARLLAEKDVDDIKLRGKSDHGKSTLKGFLASESQKDIEMKDEDVYKSKPIADLFPETTVMFGDIAGFTAWSSVREPSQVFTLLETIYHAFDEIAKRRRVFKVETVGDCYVAVCGLPDPRKDHAVNMCRFARDCMYRMWALTKTLEVVLGPDTGDLSMRVGLHSGPVTAGVLRGERSRFQLFGDTMNTAARMESNGQKSRIHLSQETADLLIAAGKSVWVTAREDKIIAKGKGELQTYWLELSDKAECGTNGSGPSGKGKKDDDSSENVSAAIAEQTGIDPEKTERLIDWNVEVLLRLLKQVVARRISQGREGTITDPGDDLILKPARGQTILDEVKEIITLPKFDAATMIVKNDTDALDLGPKIAEQLHDYVWNVASWYRNNPFHNFEHASHVTMSVIKLLSRIVAPSEHDCAGVGEDASSLHDHTYGITSDPLTQFSCVLSALIHDLDHPGVPNVQLVKENTQLSSVYKNKSVAEQNSVDIAWHLLMDDRYEDLRGSIYTDEIEMRRFRQLVVNSVMATDIVDKELKSLRNARWEKAFSDQPDQEDVQVSVNRKATIVIEHLIQASDVAHTMQHWHIYRKWNERFFMECYKAYKDGRAELDPSTDWYLGEIGFFDYYIIPLAKKLKNCGVFGVSSDEYLNYAVKNRQEWEQRGQDVVAEMLQKVNSIWTAD